jgi:hypothetical protein
VVLVWPSLKRYERVGPVGPPIACRVTLGVAQVKVAELGVMVSEGAVWSAMTVALAVAVEPLVAVKVTL